MKSKPYKQAGYPEKNIREAIRIVTDQIKDLKQTHKYLLNELRGVSEKQITT